MSEHLPITPSEIGEASIEAAEVGAAIIHLHARNPENGKPDPNPDLFMGFLPRIKQSCNAVLNVSTGGCLGLNKVERLWAATRTRPEMASLTVGSINFGISPLMQKYRDWKHSWEPEFLESGVSFHLMTGLGLEESGTTITRSLILTEDGYEPLIENLPRVDC
ncbi:3-keto-5-aminohexanoate cleavage protein [Mesorhizobium sp. M1300]